MGHRTPHIDCQGLGYIDRVLRRDSLLFTLIMHLDVDSLRGLISLCLRPTLSILRHPDPIVGLSLSIE